MPRLRMLRLNISVPRRSEDPNVSIIVLLAAAVVITAGAIAFLFRRNPRRSVRPGPGLPRIVSPLRYEIGELSNVREIYVSPHASGPQQGVDDNTPGRGSTPAMPFRTIKYVWDNVIPFDTPLTQPHRIHLMAGAYDVVTQEIDARTTEGVPIPRERRGGTIDLTGNAGHRHLGTPACPIIIQRYVDERGHTADAELRCRTLNIARADFVYLLNLNIVDDPDLLADIDPTVPADHELQAEGDGADQLHFEDCTHILIRKCNVVGGGRRAPGNVGVLRRRREALKVNQCTHVYVEESLIIGAHDNAVDFVAVQHGHIVNNYIHTSIGWGMYVKGGSAYLQIEGNDIQNCGEGGFVAGQGSGLEFMVPPFVHYEAYAIRFVNNTIRDIDGAGMGVNGGYNILLAYNTLYRVGRNSHLIEVTYGERTCDSEESIPRCRELVRNGAWGTTRPPTPDASFIVPIGCRNVYIFNNVIYNRTHLDERTVFQSGSGHFSIPERPATDRFLAPAPTPSDPSMIVTRFPPLVDVDEFLRQTVVVDQNLQIRGNVIWDGPTDHPLFENPDPPNPPAMRDTTMTPAHACHDSNPTCNAALLRTQNLINVMEPDLVDAEAGNLRPLLSGNLFTDDRVLARTAVLPDFFWDALPSMPAPPAPPPAILTNHVAADRNWMRRESRFPPGAYFLGVLRG